MDGWLPWLMATSGIGLGLLGAMVPGFPGAAVALLGVAAFAALTEYTVVTGDALLLACLLALGGGFAQMLAPVWGLRAISRASGAATGAAAGAVAGLVAPLPLGGLVFGVVGSLVGLFLGRAPLLSRIAAVLGVFPAVFVAIAVDGLAVLGIAAVFGASDFFAS